MAAPLAAGAKLLIKPIVSALKKAAIKKAAATGGAKAAGLGVREITKLSNLDVLNLVRAKAVKGTKAEVAKSLGISVKDLNATLADIKLTEARRKAVKGANYIKNANRFVKDPVKTLKGQGSRIVSNEVRRRSGQALDKAGEKIRDGSEQRETNQKVVALETLESYLSDKLQVEGFKFSPVLWAMVSELELEHIQEVHDSLMQDEYYEYKGDDTVVVSVENGGQGGGYKLGIEVAEYISYVETLLATGTAFSPHVPGEL